MEDFRRAADIGSGHGRLPGPDEKIYDLVDVLQDDVRGEEKHSAPTVGGRRIPDLVDAVDEGRGNALVDAELHEEIMKHISVIAERIAREMVPDIAERVIREEIEKLKEDV
ncbi:MAG: hypothetical protein JW943_01155 [Deltaproteobacteria bacterium]|nr:hypothetical protein [Deltaproteobacteria bacterium]